MLPERSRLVPDWIESYLEATDNTEPPILYRTWTAVSVIAAVLQRKVFLEWHTRIFPNMYIVLVGPPGRCRKGTAMVPVQKMLRDLGIKMAAEATTREALIRALRNSSNMHPNPMTGVVENHASLTIFSKELTVFLGYNNLTLISNLADWYDCDDLWTYTTKTQGTDEIMGVYVNLIGATTPELIQSSLPLDAIGGGLTSRIIFVYEEDKAKKCPAPFLTAKEKQMFEDLRNDLEQIHMFVGEFKFSESYLNHWVEWYMTQDKGIEFTDPRMAGYYERRPIHILKLSMILNASRTNMMVLEEQDLRRAIKLLEFTESRMPLTFIGVGRSKHADTLSRILNFIQSRPATTRSEILQTFYRDLDVATFDTIIQNLICMKAITMERTGNSDPLIRVIPNSPAVKNILRKDI